MHYLYDSTKHVAPPKTKSNVGKTNQFCTNCGMTNHNVETCIKKEQTTVVATQATQPSQKL
jgi:hypothetical protein